MLRTDSHRSVSARSSSALPNATWSVSALGRLFLERHNLNTVIFPLLE